MGPCRGVRQNQGKSGVRCEQRSRGVGLPTGTIRYSNKGAYTKQDYCEPIANYKYPYITYQRCRLFNTSTESRLHMELVGFVVHLHGGETRKRRTWSARFVLFR